MYTRTKENERPIYKYLKLSFSITKFHEPSLSHHHLQNTVRCTNPGTKKITAEVAAAAAADKIAR
jgi:hypothetical protein